ncbi:hypothetical protein [Anoxybacter fermentans]|nr:hypothetical protein [Anoxybacter fermentans]
MLRVQKKLKLQKAIDEAVKKRMTNIQKIYYWNMRYKLWWAKVQEGIRNA